MQVSRHYSRAPITEAIIDLKVTLPEGFSVDDLESIHAHISDHFPIKEQIHAGSLLFQSGPSIKIDASREHHGFLFRPEVVSVILDFDLFREHIWQSDDEDIWRFLEKLRHRKNLAFEASITDKTRRLID